MDNKTIQVVSPADAEIAKFPQPVGTEDIPRLAREANRLFDDWTIKGLHVSSAGGMRQRVQDWLDRNGTIIDDLEKCWGRPPTKEEYIKSVARLLCAYPAVKNDDRTAFGEILADAVMEAATTIYGLEQGIRDVYMHVKFFPTVAEVCERIGEREAHVRNMMGTRRILAKRLAKEAAPA